MGTYMQPDSEHYVVTLTPHMQVGHACLCRQATQGSSRVSALWHCMAAQAAPTRLASWCRSPPKCAELAFPSRRCQAGAVHLAQTAAAGSPSLPLQTGNAGQSCTARLMAGKQCLAEQRSSPAISDCPCQSVQAGDARRDLQEAQRAFARQQGEAHAKLEAQAAELRTALEAARAAAQGSSQQQAWEELHEQTERDGRQLREQLQDLEAQVTQGSVPVQCSFGAMLHGRSCRP